MVNKKIGIFLASVFTFMGMGVMAQNLSELPLTKKNGKECYIYEVKKGESLYGIAKKYDWDLSELQKFNPGAIGELKKGESLYYPTYNDAVASNPVNSPGIAEVVESSDIAVTALPDTTWSAGTVEIISPVISEPAYDNVRLAVVLDNAKAKKDIEFTRGALLALNEMKKAPYKIDFKVIDGQLPPAEILAALEGFNPNLIFSTADKTFPECLLSYGNDHNVEIVNVFYLKNDLASDNKSLIQMLPPSSFFNQMVASSIYLDNLEGKLVCVGIEDPNDSFGTELTKLYDTNETFTPETLTTLELNSVQTRPVIIYSYASKKEDIESFLTSLEQLEKKYPAYDFFVLGRSNWVVYKDELKSQFEKFGVHIPSRVWLDMDSYKWKNFLANYSYMFNGTPVKSFPNFAASGYDMATFFIPRVAELNGDYHHGIKDSDGNLLQTDIQLFMEKDSEGYMNGVAYLIKFVENGEDEKVILK